MSYVLIAIYFYDLIKCIFIGYIFFCNILFLIYESVKSNSLLNLVVSQYEQAYMWVNLTGI